jgi:hypothetical protein
MRSHCTKLGLEIHQWFLYPEDWSQLITETQRAWDKAGEIAETGDVEDKKIDWLRIGGTVFEGLTLAGVAKAKQRDQRQISSSRWTGGRKSQGATEVSGRINLD